MPLDLPGQGVRWAFRSRFVSKRDGAPNRKEARWGKFKLHVPKAAGGHLATLAPPHTTGISLSTDATQVCRADGSGRMTSNPHTPDIPTPAQTTPKMTRIGTATRVMGLNALARVTVERTRFCADLAPLVGRGGELGRAAGKVGERDCWVRGAVEGDGVLGYGAGGVMGRGRRGRRRGAGRVHMWTVWKLMESQGSVNFRSLDVSRIVRRAVQMANSQQKTMSSPRGLSGPKNAARRLKEVTLAAMKGIDLKEKSLRFDLNLYKREYPAIAKRGE